jgi:C4-dicarboxylate transporter
VTTTILWFIPQPADGSHAVSHLLMTLIAMVWHEQLSQSCIKHCMENLEGFFRSMPKLNSITVKLIAAYQIIQYAEDNHLSRVASLKSFNRNNRISCS